MSGIYFFFGLLLLNRICLSRNPAIKTFVMPIRNCPGSKTYLSSPHRYTLNFILYLRRVRRHSRNLEVSLCSLRKHTFNFALCLCSLPKHTFSPAVYLGGLRRDTFSFVPCLRGLPKHTFNFSPYQRRLRKHKEGSRGQARLRFKKPPGKKKSHTVNGNWGVVKGFFPGEYLVFPRLFGRPVYDQQISRASTADVHVLVGLLKALTDGGFSTAVLKF